MAVIKIGDFGGERPSLSSRALPASAAQENRNLFLGVTEFRPLKEDSTVASCSSGTKSLHRFARKADGSFNSDATTGWITSTAYKSYVKGQINDERTERTYVTFDDGSARPRVIDVNGSDRLLGVPRPVKPVVTANITDEVTNEDADSFLYGDFIARVQASLASNRESVEPLFRYQDGVPLAGAYDLHGAVLHSDLNIPDNFAEAYWCVFVDISTARTLAVNLDVVRLGAKAGPPDYLTWYFPIFALPAMYVVDTPGLTAALAAIESPTGGALLSSEDVGVIVAKVTEYLDPNRYAKTQRDQLDALLLEFVDLLNNATVEAAVARPTAPAKPTVPEYYVSGFDEITGAPITTRDPAWVTYDAAYATYQSDLADYEDASSARFQDSASLNNRLAEIQAAAQTLTVEIETLGLAAWNELVVSQSIITSLVDAQGGAFALIPDTVVRIIDSRFYVVTMVTDWGEESEPSEPSDMIEIDQNDSASIALPALASGDSYASRNITKWRIYRSNVGSVSAAFQLVDEVAIASTSYTDTKKGAELQEPLPSLTWSEPPYRMDGESASFPKPVVGTNPYLRGLVGLPNGIMAGFFDNTVAFCEPYIPYAWPVEYQITTEFPVVGLGVFGQTLFVGTTANPYFISGADSASMSGQKLDSNQACVSRLSVATVQGGVLYASPDGLCVADSNGVTVISAGLYTREDWQALNPTSMFAISHENIYYLFYDNGTKGCLTFDLASKKLGRVDLQADAAFVDRLTDTLYVVNGTSIKAVLGAETRRTGRWKSGRMAFEAQAALAWLVVLGEQTSEVPVTVRWYGDGVLRYTATLTSITPVRLPAGRYLEHEVEVESKARVTSVLLAGATQELQSL